MEADEAEELKAWLLQKADVKIKKKKKGQKASSKTQKPVLKKPAAIQSKASEKKKKKKETKVEIENKKGSCKVPFKKRKCDSAYHSAKNRAKKDGYSLEEACAAGSAAAAKMAADIDTGLVKDPSL